MLRCLHDQGNYCSSLVLFRLLQTLLCRWQMKLKQGIICCLDMVICVSSVSKQSWQIFPLDTSEKKNEKQYCNFCYLAQTCVQSSSKEAVLHHRPALLVQADPHPIPVYVNHCSCFLQLWLRKCRISPLIFRCSWETGTVWQFSIWVCW